MWLSRPRVTGTCRATCQMVRWGWVSSHPGLGRWILLQIKSSVGCPGAGTEGSQRREGFVLCQGPLVPLAPVSGASGSLSSTLRGGHLGRKNENIPDQNFFSEVLTDSWPLSPVRPVPCLCLVFSSRGMDTLRYWTYADPPQGSCLWCVGVWCVVLLLVADSCYPSERHPLSF